MLSDDLSEEIKQMRNGIICHQCLAMTVIIKAKVLFGEEASERRGGPDALYRACLPCKAYVKCKDGSEDGAGLVADARLRKARMQAYPLWNALVARTVRVKKIDEASAYSQVMAWVANLLEIDHSDCRTNWLDADQLEVFIAEASKYVKQ